MLTLLYLFGTYLLTGLDMHTLRCKQHLLTFFWRDSFHRHAIHSLPEIISLHKENYLLPSFELRTYFSFLQVRFYWTLQNYSTLSVFNTGSGLVFRPLISHLFLTRTQKFPFQLYH